MKKKTVVITGTSSGIGLETALLLAERGYEVYATLRDPGRGAVLKAEAARRKAALHILQLDVTDQSSIRAAIDTVLKESGAIYALVNNAGIYMRGYFEDLSSEDVQQVFDTNVFGTMKVTRAVLPGMRSAGQGRIITVTSVAGRSGALTASAYCASKFALEGFAESLMQEVMPWGIRVSIIEPAILKSDQWATDYGSVKGAQNKSSPYYELYGAAKKLMDTVARSSPTENKDVARCIYKALTARHPRLRYMVGSRAKLLFALRRYIPGDFIERAYSNAAIRRVTRPL
ncbi:MAG: SDR family oxidoreductase [Pseudomonadota bacterium]